MRRGTSVGPRLLRALGAAVLATLMACGKAAAPAPPPPEAGGAGFVPDTKPVPKVKWVEATIPKGTRIKLSLIDTLTTKTSHKGDPFRALVTEAILLEGTVMVPSGSNVVGSLQEVVPAATGYRGKGGMLSLEFARIDTPTGATAPLSARLVEVGRGRFPAVLEAGAAGPAMVTSGQAGIELILGSNTGLVLELAEPLRIKVEQ